MLNRDFYQLVVTVVMKNCEPFVSGPAFAMDRRPALMFYIESSIMETS